MERLHPVVEQMVVDYNKGLTVNNTYTYLQERNRDIEVVTEHTTPIGLYSSPELMLEAIAYLEILLENGILEPPEQKEVLQGHTLFLSEKLAEKINQMPK